MLPVAVDRFFSDGVAIRSELLVLRTTSRFHTVGSAGRIKHDVMFRSVCINFVCFEFIEQLCNDYETAYVGHMLEALCPLCPFENLLLL